MDPNINLVWIGDDRDTREMILQYAAQFGKTFPDAADILEAVDEGGRLLGFTAVLSTEVISDILVFHVVPEEGGDDTGHLMLRELEKVIGDTGIAILRYIMPRDEELMIFFYDEGYDIFDGGREYAVRYASLSYSPVYRKNIEAAEVQKAVSIGDCTPKEQKILKEFFIDNSIATMDYFNPVLSSVVFDGSDVMGMLLCETKPKGIIIYYMYAKEDHPEYLIDCLRVLDRILSEYKEQDPELMLSFATGNDMEVSLLQHLTGNIIPIEEFVREGIAIKPLKAM